MVKKSFINKIETSLSKSKKVREKYFFETPFITIKEPRPLTIYSKLLESELVKHGLLVSSLKNHIESKPNERHIPFSGTFSAKLLGLNEKDVWQVNFWLLIMGVISVAYSVVTFFFTLTRWLIIPLICFFIIQSVIALVSYIRALRKKELHTKFYQIKPLLIVETLISSGVLVYALFLLIILVIYTMIGSSLSIILSAAIILSSILIIIRCFSTFKIKGFLATQKEPLLELIISYNGIIYQKIHSKKNIGSNELNQQQTIRTPELLEVKFEICVLDADDELIEANLRLISDIKKSISRVLSSKPVILTDSETTEQTIETTYLVDNEPRVFPIDTQITSEPKYKRINQG